MDRVMDRVIPIHIYHLKKIVCLFPNLSSVGTLAVIIGFHSIYLPFSPSINMSGFSH